MQCITQQITIPEFPLHKWFVYHATFLQRLLSHLKTEPGQTSVSQQQLLASGFPKNVVIPRCLNMVSHRTKRILRYLGPFLFFLGLAYTAFYPERKLLQYKGHEEKTTTLFMSQGAVTLREEIPLASCRVSKYKNLEFLSAFSYKIVV